jgi:hypothetical protein
MVECESHPRLCLGSLLILIARANGQAGAGCPAPRLAEGVLLAGILLLGKLDPLPDVIQGRGGAS